MQTVCETCGAPIRWVRTVNGRMMPINAQDVPYGNVALVEGVAHVVKDQKLPGPYYLSHFVTCPKADSHRKKGKPQQQRTLFSGDGTDG